MSYETVKTTDGIVFSIRPGTSDIKTLRDACGFIEKNENPSYYRMRGDFELKVKDGDVWLDLGAQIGAFTCRAIKDGAKKVIAFEPHPENYEMLEKNVIQNEFSEKAYLINAAVVGKNKDGNRKNLYVTNSTYRHTLLPPTTKNNGATIETDVMELDAVLDAHPDVNALKMDIEGSELDVLLNTRLFCTGLEKFVFEYSFDHFPETRDFFKLCDHLRRTGFDVYHKPSLSNLPEKWDHTKTRGNNGVIVWCKRRITECKQNRDITMIDAGYFYDMKSVTECTTYMRESSFNASDSASTPWKVIRENTHMIDAETGEPVVIVCKNVLTTNEVDEIVNSLIKVAKGTMNNTRGIAAGRIDVDRIRTQRPGLRVGRMTDFKLYALRKDGTVSNSHFANPASSAIVGWTDIPPRNDKSKKRRLTAWTEKNLEKCKESWPGLEKVSNAYMRMMHDRWKKQDALAGATDTRFGETAFSTITVNWKYRSALHQDKGDYKEGMGCLFMQADSNGGGELLFPEYGIAAALETGDLLLFNPHIWHCTAPIADSNPRSSFVCYFRENLAKNINKDAASSSNN